MTEAELRSVRDYQDAQALLDPIQKIVTDWSASAGHQFTKRISNLHLVASGDLTKNWIIQVRAFAGAGPIKAASGLTRGRSVVVAEFLFPEYGRLFDMRRVNYDKPVPPKKFIDWVEDKVDRGEIEYSRLAERRGWALSDPRVIHDLAYRFAKTQSFNPRRRRWYNKGKEASVNDLYDQLQEALTTVALAASKADFNLQGQKRGRGRTLDVDSRFK